MSVLMTVFGQKACREYVLDDRRQCHHRIVLDAGFFGLAEDLPLSLIRQDGRWRVESEKDEINIGIIEENAAGPCFVQRDCQMMESCDSACCMIMTPGR